MKKKTKQRCDFIFSPLGYRCILEKGHRDRHVYNAKQLEGEIKEVSLIKEENMISDRQKFYVVKANEAE